jgi:hypothetical protein
MEANGGMLAIHDNVHNEVVGTVARKSSNTTSNYRASMKPMSYGNMATAARMSTTEVYLGSNWIVIRIEYNRIT